MRDSLNSWTEVEGALAAMVIFRTVKCDLKRRWQMLLSIKMIKVWIVSCEVGVNSEGRRQDYICILPSDT